MAGKPQGMTAHRLRGASLLAEGKRVEEVATLLGVTSKTVWEWKQIPEFKEEVKRRQDQLLDSAHVLLRSQVESAVNVLREIALDPKEKGSVRVQAANSILDRLGVKEQPKPDIHIHSPDAELVKKLLGET